MRAPIFGLSTTPVTDIKSVLRLQLERDLLALVYRSARRAMGTQVRFVRTRQRL